MEYLQISSVERCAMCGELFDGGEWHPVATDYTEDGTIRIHELCSEDCRDRWRNR